MLLKNFVLRSDTLICWRLRLCNYTECLCSSGWAHQLSEGFVSCFISFCLKRCATNKQKPLFREAFHPYGNTKLSREVITTSVVIWNHTHIALLVDWKIISSPVVIQSTLSKTETFGTGTSCPSKRDVRLIESQIEGVKTGRD